MHNPANQSKHTIISILNSFFTTYLLLVYFLPLTPVPLLFFLLFFFSHTKGPTDFNCYMFSNLKTASAH